MTTERGFRLSVEVQPGRLELDKKFLRQTLRAAGSEVAAVARSLIRSSPAGGNLYGQHRASAPGQAPASLSGALASGFKVRVGRNGESVSIRDSVYYALFMEKGARGGGGDTTSASHFTLRSRLNGGKRRMKKRFVNKSRVLQPRPFLTAALEMREESIAKRVAQSINEGVKFVKLKPVRSRS